MNYTDRYQIYSLYLCLVLFCSFLGRPAIAQTSLKTDQVLSNYLIYQVIQDNTGFIWASTDEGIFRYDGYQMVGLNQLLVGKQQLPGGQYKLALHQNDLWILGEAGLFCYSITRCQLNNFLLPTSVNAGYPIRWLAIDKKHDRLWVARNSQELLAVTLSQGTVITGSYRRFPFAISWLASAADGSLWIVAFDHRIVHLQADGRQQYYRGPAGKYLFPIPDTQPQQFVSACAQYAAHPTGRLYETRRWLAANNRHLTEWSPFSLPQEPGGLQWVAGDYLVRLRQQPGTKQVTGSTIEAIQLENHKKYDGPIFYVIFRTRLDNELFFSPELRGCYKRSSVPAIQAISVAQKSWYSTRAIVRLPDQRLLVSSYTKTLVQPAGQPGAALQPWPVWEGNKLVTTIFHSLLPLTPTQLLAADDSGFHLLDVRTHRRRRLGTGAGSSLLLPGVFLVRGPTGKVWAGARTGLFWLDSAHLWLHPYHNARLEPALRTMQALAPAANGALWLATTTGLYHVNPHTGAVQRFATGLPNMHALPTNQLLSLQVAGNQVWVGTRDQGLLLVDPLWGVVRQLTTTDGLPSHTVCSLLADQQHNLWLGTYAGIVRYHPPTGDLVVFTTADGLADEECNYQSAFRDADGSLYFGSVKGLSHIQPKQLIKRKSPYRRLVISELICSTTKDTTNNFTYPLQHIGTGKILHLLTDDLVTIRVALTDYISPETTQYWYRLRGIADTTWHRTTQPHAVRLANLPRGNYTVVIKARSASGVWATNELLIPVQVDLVWWKHPVMWGASGLLVVKGIALYGWYVRRRHYKQQQQLRGQLAHDLHDELGALLVRASLQAELLKGQHAANVTTATNLLQNIQAASQAMRDIVWSIDPHNNTFGNLLGRIEEYLAQTAILSSRHVEFQHHGMEETQAVSAEMRQHIYAIFKEAVTNSLRHARSSNLLLVKVISQNNILSMSVQDDGQALTSAKHQGTGLRSMARRAHALGGEIEARARPGGGFQVILTVPLAKEAH